MTSMDQVLSDTEVKSIAENGEQLEFFALISKTPAPLPLPPFLSFQNASCNAEPPPTQMKITL